MPFQVHHYSSGPLSDMCAVHYSVLKLGEQNVILPKTDDVF